ncbi:MAG: GIY-YIG nuclease family protein [Thermoanaerobaculia bacterium]
MVPPRPGYYSIWIDDPVNLPAPYGDYLRERDTTLLYVGIATKSLLERLVEQDLRHKSASTFFRAIGPILGFRPPRGSLIGKKNTRNYTFAREDTNSIVAWIDAHLSVGFVENPAPAESVEGGAIQQLRPLLNSKHNPDALPALAALRAECRELANSPG